VKPGTGEWIQAGFFVITDGKAPARQGSPLPARVVTVCTCIGESYPDAWALPGVEVPEKTLSGVRRTLALDDREFGDLRTWVERALENEALGWPNVFFSLREARSFSARFLGAVRNVRLVGLSLSADVAAEFLRAEAPPAGSGGTGVWKALARNVPLAREDPPLGFDVLGFEPDGTSHTFACNGLEVLYKSKLGTAFNVHGLIDDYGSAAVASEATNRDGAGAEPVPWYPFRVDEYRFDEDGRGSARR